MKEWEGHVGGVPSPGEMGKLRERWSEGFRSRFVPLELWREEDLELLETVETAPEPIPKYGVEKGMGFFHIDVA